MHASLNLAAVLACHEALQLRRAWPPCWRAAARAAAEAHKAQALATQTMAKAQCERYGKQLATQVFGWGKWQGPSVQIDTVGLFDD